MNWLSQVIAVTAVDASLDSPAPRIDMVAVIGIAGVVIVFTAVLSIAEGFRAAMRGTGDPQTVIVLRQGSDTEMTSGFSGDDVKLISEAPGIEQGPQGPSASPELFVIVGHPLKRSGTDANVPLRGVSLAALKVRPRLKIVEGRMFQPGTNEIVVGRAASRQFVGLTVGSSVRWGESTWQVVGLFEADGSVAESEIWCDAKVLQPAYRRGNSYQSVYLRLEIADALQKLKDALTVDPRLNVTVDSRARLLRAAVAGPANHHSHNRDCDRRVDGTRCHVRRGEYDVFRGRRESAGNRYPACARLREKSGCRFRPRRVAVIEPRRRCDRRTAGVGGVRRVSDGDHELAVVQSSRVCVCRHSQLF